MPRQASLHGLQEVAEPFFYDREAVDIDDKPTKARLRLLYIK